MRFAFASLVAFCVVIQATAQTPLPEFPSSDIPVEPRLSALSTVLVQVIHASKTPKPSPSAQTENTVAKQATPDAFVKTIQSMKSSITPIVCKYESAGEIKALLGTAVYLDQAGRFLTAAHVIDAANKACPNGTDVHVSQDEWTMNDRMVRYHRFEFQTARCIWDSATDVDLALCATDLNLTDIKVKVRPVQFDFTQQWDGNAVAYTGFHVGNSIPMTARGYFGMYTAIGDAFVLNQSTWLGASGGPVYLSDGRVIGLMVQPGNAAYAGRTLDSLFAGRAFARSAKAIQAFLARAEAVEMKRAPPK